MATARTKVPPRTKSNDVFEDAIFEDIRIVEASAGEGENPTKILAISGVGCKTGIINKNNRLYPTDVMIKAIETAQASVRSGKFLGELDHPDWSATLQHTALKITKLWMDGDLMRFEADVIPTHDGEKLAALLKAGVGVGMSTRGRGRSKFIDLTTTPTPGGQPMAEEEGYWEILPGYRLDGIDCVAQESNPFGQIQHFEQEELPMSLTLEQLKTEHPEVYEAVKAEVLEAEKVTLAEQVNADFDAKVAEAVEAKKTELRADIMENDEEIKDMRSKLETVKSLFAPAQQTQEGENGEGTVTESQTAQLASENATLKESQKTLQEKVTELEGALSKKENEIKVKEHIASKTKGHKFEAKLAERLATCESVEDVDAKFEAEVAFIESIVEAENPAGKGIVEQEDDTNRIKYSADQARQRELAGLK